MVTLTLLNSNNHQTIKEWHFNHNNIIKIGRVSDNDLILSNFPQVSRYHLELRKIKNKNNWKAVSIGQNGAFINGVFFEETLLPNNALIQLAKKGPLLKFSLGTKKNKFNGLRPSNFCLLLNKYLTLICAIIKGIILTIFFVLIVENL